MGLDELKQEIIEKANKEAESIETQASKEADKILNEAKTQAKEIQKHANAEAEKNISVTEKREIAKANFDVKKQLLDKKQELISKAFEEAKEQLKNLSTEKNKQFFDKLLATASTQMEIATLYINKKDKAFVREYSWLNVEILGGLIAENKDKTIRIDFSYDTLLESSKSKALGEVVKTLFG